MTVRELTEQAGFRVLSMPDGEREIEGVYAGDLLSWVMGRASEGQAFVTIMTNINVLAVASLLDLSCVILSEDAEAPSEIIVSAEEKGINLLKTELPTYETCLLLGSLL
ncbi:MAG: hypothetical protein II715_02925 [Clostridia bacterium]|nr:hypothetical protein [Clostridia bacterium]